MASSKQPNQSEPPAGLVERRKRYRPGDRLPAPEVVDEGNTDEDWALWQRSWNGQSADHGEGETQPMPLDGLPSAAVSEKPDHQAADGSTAPARLRKD